MSLLDKIRNLPDSPGVYMFHDKMGKIIYIGEAKCLAKRVRSYFRMEDLSIKHTLLRNKIFDLTYIVTDNPIEALILECNLIKQHKPKYNIRLKDDKTFPFIKITAEDFPRIYITRRVKEDGGRYFGPYTDVKDLRHTLKLVRKTFPVRGCRYKLGKKRLRPCLDYHIKQCLAPCAGLIDKKTYSGMVEGISLFFQGRISKLLGDLTKKMESRARDLRFEEAARIRDQIKMIEKVMGKQKVLVEKDIDQDVIALVTHLGKTLAAVFFVRQGRLIDTRYFFLEGGDEDSTDTTISSFIKQYYSTSSSIPKEILVKTEISDSQTIVDWLSFKKGGRVIISVPKRGKRLDLIQMAERNARLFLEKESSLNAALVELKGLLHLPRLPRRIFAFDISNISGKLPTGSLVTYEDGKPSKSGYRRFKIKTVSGPNDVGMLREVIKRCFEKALNEKTHLPDLIIVDGGKAQLNQTYQVLASLGLSSISAIGIAKKRDDMDQERIYTLYQEKPIILPHDSDSLYLLQNIRDEAHRFAISYHRRLRKLSAENRK
ncbi:MAG: excinuclease ABC subunit UvrC [bacterium]|nr:excinuclease ABC subunit UvrC [bacterium]